MMNDTLNWGQEVILTIGGKEWTLTRLTQDKKLALVALAVERLGDPVADAKRAIEGLSADVALPLLQDALKLSRERQSITHPEVAAFLLATEDGLSLTLRQLLEARHPEVTLDQANGLLVQWLVENGNDSSGIEKLDREILKTFGHVPDRFKKKRPAKRSPTGKSSTGLSKPTTGRQLKSAK